VCVLAGRTITTSRVTIDMMWCLRARASAADQSKPRWRDLAVTVMTRSTTAMAYAPAPYEVAAHSAGACFLESSPDRR
jgi:hypothetical protein